MASEEDDPQAEAKPQPDYIKSSEVIIFTQHIITWFCDYYLMKFRGFVTYH